MSKPSRKTPSGKAVQAMIAELTQRQAFQLRPVPAAVRRICANWPSHNPQPKES